MSLEKNKKSGDSGQIAEELLQDGMPETERRCYSVRETVENGVLTLQEALSAYEITEEEYRKFSAAHG